MPAQLLVSNTKKKKKVVESKKVLQKTERKTLTQRHYTYCNTYPSVTALTGRYTRPNQNATPVHPCSYSGIGKEAENYYDLGESEVPATRI